MILIDAEQLKRDLPHDTSEDLAIAFSMSQIIDESPTIDAVEVVRCKNCKYRKDRLYC